MTPTLSGVKTVKLMQFFKKNSLLCGIKQINCNYCKDKPEGLCDNGQGGRYPNCTLGNTFTIYTVKHISFEYN
jgi:hypothetical protein